uniref:Uncharacterized protein n=1 Tax=Anopheles stephensi TaxID=30069 RepID=A0A182YJG2_ANOST
MVESARYGQDISHHFTAYLPKLDPESSSYQQQQQQQQQSSSQQQFIALAPLCATPSATSASPSATSGGPDSPQRSPSQKKSLAMCFTSTGTALSLPPKKKDIYRPYSLDDRPPRPSYELRIPAEEDLHAAHAILDLSASTAFLPPPAPHQILAQQQSPPSPSHQHAPTSPTVVLVSAKSSTSDPDRRPLQTHHHQPPHPLHQQASPLPPQSPPSTVPHSLSSPEQNENRNSTNTLPGYASHDVSMDSSSDELQQSTESSDSEGKNGSKTVAYTSLDGSSMDELRSPPLPDRRPAMALKREKNVDIEGDESDDAMHCPSPMSPVPHLTISPSAGSNGTGTELKAIRIAYIEALDECAWSKIGLERGS